MKSLTCIALALCVSPIVAASQEMPEYFLDEIVAASWAEQVAKFCPQLSVNPISAAQLSQALLERLSEDGIDLDTVEAASDADAIAQRQAVFLEKHGLIEPDQAAICAAGRAEIAEGSPIGAYLTEVSQ